MCSNTFVKNAATTPMKAYSMVVSEVINTGFKISVNDVFRISAFAYTPAPIPTIEVDAPSINFCKVI